VDEQPIRHAALVSHHGIGLAGDGELPVDAGVQGNGREAGGQIRRMVGGERIECVLTAHGRAVDGARTYCGTSCL
jgi:hypothetical protein